MKTTTVTEFRKNIKEHLDGIEADRISLSYQGQRKKVL
jgi:hypothetical protein